MKAYAEGLPRADAVVLMLELLDRGLSVKLETEEGKETYMVAGIDLEPKPTPAPSFIDQQKEKQADDAAAANGWVNEVSDLRERLDRLHKEERSHLRKILGGDYFG